MRAYLRIDASNGVFSYFFHFRQYFISEIVLPVTQSVQVVLKLRVGQFVGRLVFAIVRKMFLYGIICQMYLWIEAMDIEVIRWGSDVSLFVPIASSYSIEIGDKHVMSDIELPIIVEKGSVDIHLHDVCFLGLFCLLLLFAVLALLFSLSDDVIQFVNLVNYCDSSSLVGVFSRFNYPNVSGLF